MTITEKSFQQEEEENSARESRLSSCDSQSKPVTEVKTKKKKGRKIKVPQDVTRIHYSLIDTPYVKMPLKNIYDRKVRKLRQFDFGTGIFYKPHNRILIECYVQCQTTWDLIMVEIC